MDDARGVRGDNAVGNLEAELDHAMGRHLASFEELAQRFALHQLADDEREAGLFADVVERNEGGMIEPARGPRFLLEPGAPAHVPRHALWQNLERDVAPEARIVGSINDAQAAGAP